MNATALITGASRGIGRSVAEHLARQGYELILLARNNALLEDLADTLRAAHGVSVQTLAIDLGSTRLGSAIESALADWDHLDLLVNAAGIFRFGTAEQPPEDLEALLTTNVLGTHRVCQASLPWLNKARRGQIVNLSSITGIETYAPVGGYCASKHALVGYGQSLGKACIEQGVRVTTLCPDVVNTDMGAPSGLDPAEMIEPEDIGRCIDFLKSLSDAAVVDQIPIRCKAIMTGAGHT